MSQGYESAHRIPCGKRVLQLKLSIIQSNEAYENSFYLDLIIRRLCFFQLFNFFFISVLCINEHLIGFITKYP
jgi:hypothetical protein